VPLPSETFKVFISHATIPDSSLANWMADALDRIHIRAYVYERYQMGGQNRFEVIKSMISTCPYFLVLLTKEGISSQWVNQEIGYAIAKGKNPIPIIEWDPQTGYFIKSKGFIELNDPIRYDRGYEHQFMAHVLYTFYGLLWGLGRWKDSIFLSCRCGNEFDGALQFVRWWDIWLRDPERKPFPVVWTCSKCQQNISISFPDCHLLR
jgi:hypothetical protein